MHLLTSIPHTNFALHLEGSTVIVLRAAMDDDPGGKGQLRWESVSELTTDHVAALKYDLAYWTGALGPDDLSHMRFRLFGGRNLTQLSGCLYDL